MQQLPALKKFDPYNDVVKFAIVTFPRKEFGNIMILKFAVDDIHAYIKKSLAFRMAISMI